MTIWHLSSQEERLKHDLLIQPKLQKTKIKENKNMSTSISILGNIGGSVELKYTPQGTAIANFSIASNSTRKTKEGKKKIADWFNVSAFGKQAETLAKYLTKGSQILVRGKLSLSPWQTREGEPRVNADVVLQDFEFAGNGKRDNVETDYGASPIEDVDSEIASQESVEDADEKAEMLAIWNQPDASDESFAGQY
jgi:single-strand DNA-binding protein